MYSRTTFRTIGMLTALFLATLALGLVMLSGYSLALADDPMIIYVDADANVGGDGQTWGTAYKHLQDALDGANADGSSDYEIWVAEGIYYPDEDDDGDHISDAVTETFRLSTNNVQLYGGFAGTETTREERDWQAHITVLSGDIDDNDTADANGVVTDTDHINGDNSYHVLYLDGTTNEPITGTTTIDGFTITAGHASAKGSWVDTDDGGGLYCMGLGDGSECSPMLTNLTFRGNAAYYNGGAMHNRGQHGRSHPTLMHVTFSGNSAGYGGAMYNNSYWSGYSSPKLTDVTFSGNSAGCGGAMYNYAYKSGRSHPVLTDVTFISNSAVFGGAIYSYGQKGWSSPRLEDVTFIGNSASGSATGSDGGAMYNDGEDGSSSPTLTNVAFIGNWAEGGGGAIFNNATNSGSSNPRLTNVTFRNNTAGRGGAMFSWAYTGRSNPRLVNVVFSGNSASDSGGAMYNHGDRGTCNPTFINVTFSNNSAGGCGAMVNKGYLDPTHGHPSFDNVILWGNMTETEYQICNIFASIHIGYSIVEGGWDGSGIHNNNSTVYDDGGNIEDDPQFVDAASGDVHLQSTSPAIDAGDNSAVPVDVTTDLDGNPRFVDYPPEGGTGDGTSPFVDIGAYEMQTGSFVYLPLLLKQ